MKTFTALALTLTLFTPFYFLEAAASEIKLDSMHEKAPALTFRDANGKTAQLSDYRGKKVILHFWASWCKPCLKELPDLQKLTLAGKSKNIVFLPVSSDDLAHEAVAKAFIASVPGNLPLWIVFSSADAYLTWGMPVTYFINEEGTIVGRALGQKDWTKQTDLDHFLDQTFALPNQNK